MNIRNLIAANLNSNTSGSQPVSSGALNRSSTDTSFAKPNISILRDSTLRNSTLENSKTQNLSKAERKTFGTKVQSLVTNGFDYLKNVRDEADKQRKNGIGGFEAGNKLWGQLLVQVDGIGKQAQDLVLDDIAAAIGDSADDLLKNTKVGGWIDEAINLTSKAGVATKGAAAAGSAGEIASSLTGGLAKRASGIGAAYSLYKLIDDFGESSPLVSGLHGATVGATIGSVIPGVGTLIGAGIGALAGGVLGLFNKGKHPEHAARDHMREVLKEGGFIDDQYGLKLADGSSFSLNQDGKDKLQNIDGSERAPYQVDFSNPLTVQAIGWLNPLAEVMTSGHDKLKTDLVGYLVNAVTSNASSMDDVRNNVLAIFSQAKIPMEEIAKGLATLFTEGKLNDAELQAYGYGLDTLINPQLSAATTEPLISAVVPASGSDNAGRLEEHEVKQAA